VNPVRSQYVPATTSQVRVSGGNPVGSRYAPPAMPSQVRVSNGRNKPGSRRTKAPYVEKKTHTNSTSSSVDDDSIPWDSFRYTRTLFVLLIDVHDM